MIYKKIMDQKYIEDKIVELKKECKFVDIQLLEKTVGALSLVEQLVLLDIDFIFKGGTSLTVLFEDLKRFSVDVDIITEEDEEELENKFSEILNRCELFTRFEIDERNNASSKRMKLKHYKFYFTSVQDLSEKYILLDVAFESNVYSKTVKKKIKCPKIDVDSEVEVKLPSIESVLGDKLNVIAPNTVGISFESKKMLEMIKQLYDVGNLFDYCNDINDVRESFIKISTRELDYRKLSDHTYEDVLADIEEFCLELVYLSNEEHIKKLASGLQKAKGYLLVSNYVLDVDGIADASKILCLISILRQNNCIIKRYDKENFDDNVDLSWIDGSKRKRLNKIKKVHKEAFYYLLEYEKNKLNK